MVKIASFERLVRYTCMWQKSLILTFLVLQLHFNSSGQSLERKNDFLSQFAPTSPDSVIVLSSDQPISAIAVKSDREGVFSMVFDGEVVQIPKDEDAENFTYFISLKKLVTQLVLNVPPNPNFTLFLINSGDEPTIDKTGMRLAESDECLEPIMYVDQTAWREGLPPPSYTRSFHEVKHHVVHHSAGSNSSTNYTQVVRDIYIYHTQVNGWSDIGYNYLIAQDGTIFAGRDPDGGSQSKVRGAHFCGSNTGTLGVCLLGNYETATPTDNALLSLENLLSYELLTLDLDPFETFNHPLGNLGTVVGHRDGCSTLCPGENVYSMLGELKQSLSAIIESCNPKIPLSILVDTTLLKVNDLLTLTAEGSYESFRWLLPGASQGEVAESIAEVRYSTPGYYDVTLIGENGADKDTLQLKDYIQVSLLESEPFIFPNPAIPFQAITIDYKASVITSKLYDIHGRLVSEFRGHNPSVGGLNPGIYLLKILTAQGLFEKKLVIR